MKERWYKIILTRPAKSDRRVRLTCEYVIRADFQFTALLEAFGQCSGDSGYSVSLIELVSIERI